MSKPHEISAAFNRAFSGYAYAVLTVREAGEGGKPIPIYADPELRVPHCNPIVADGNGIWPPIWTDQPEVGIRIDDGDAPLVNYDAIRA